MPSATENHHTEGSMKWTREKENRRLFSMVKSMCVFELAIEWNYKLKVHQFWVGKIGKNMLQPTDLNSHPTDLTKFFWSYGKPGEGLVKTSTRVGAWLQLYTTQEFDLLTAYSSYLCHLRRALSNSKSAAAASRE